MTRIVPLFALVATVACKRPPEAPKKLDELSQYLYAEWDTEDPEVLAAGLLNLRDFMKDVDLESNQVLDRSWELTAISQEAADEVDHPGRQAKNTLGVGVATQSIWDLEDHARLQTERDQTIAEPSAAAYTRTFPSENDPTCFVQGDCEVLESDNDITRENLLMSVNGQLFKSFRWVEMEDGEWAFLSRSWIPDSWIGDAEKSKVWQSFSIDVWIPSKKGAWRYQTTWSESEVANASDKIKIGTVKSSIDGIFKAGDEAIEELYK